MALITAIWMASKVKRTVLGLIHHEKLTRQTEECFREGALTQEVRLLLDNHPDLLHSADEIMLKRARTVERIEVLEAFDHQTGNDIARYQALIEDKERIVERLEHQVGQNRDAMPAAVREMLREGAMERRMALKELLVTNRHQLSELKRILKLAEGAKKAFEKELAKKRKRLLKKKKELWQVLRNAL